MRELGRTPALLFPAAMIPNADPNALDDYDESDFLPALTFGTQPTGLTYGTRYGMVTKIGRLVHVAGRIVLTSKGLVGSGSATIAGLPFASPALTAVGAVRLNNFSASGGPTGSISGAVLSLEIQTTTGITPLTWAMLTNTSDLSFSATYATST